MSETDRDSTSSGAATSNRCCANCGRELPEHFCPRCGQSDRDYTRSLRSVTGEFLRETFQLDARLVRTLKLLLFRPGSLTGEFSLNRRASHVSPVKLYIFASFVFFLTMSLAGPPLDQAVQAGVSDNERQLLESRPPSEDHVEAFRNALPEESRSRIEGILALPDEDPFKAFLLNNIATENPAEWPPIERALMLGIIELLYDASLFEERFMTNVPIVMFFMLPWFACALLLFNFRRRRYYVEHLVFATHVQTFMFLAYTLALLMLGRTMAWLPWACAMIPFAYLLIAMRQYYRNGWVLTVVKWMGVQFLYVFVLVPAFLIATVFVF